jgi:putative copper resistance protein D
MTEVAFWTIVSARWMQFAAAMVLFGTSLFPFYALPSTGASETTQVTRTARRALSIAALVGAVSALAWVAASILGITEDSGALADPDTLSQYFFETSFGRVWLLRLVLALLVLAVTVLGRASLFARNASTALVALLAGTLLVSQAWIGHPASLPGSERWLVTAAFALHVLGGAVWLGALVPLGLLLVRVRKGGGASDLAEFALRRFSPVGMIAVASILAGGIVNAISRAGSLDAFVASTWGQIVMLKTVLFTAMIVFAILNRFVLMPHWSAQTEMTAARLARNIAYEQLAGLLILAASAMLAVFHPPLCESAPILVG